MNPAVSAFASLAGSATVGAARQVVSGLAPAASAAQAAPSSVAQAAGPWLPEGWPRARRAPDARSRSSVAGVCRRWGAAGGLVDAGAPLRAAARRSSASAS